MEGKIFLARGDDDLGMKPHHEEALKRSLKGGRADVQFQTVSSAHFHYGNSSLWFHPDHDDKASLQKLEYFLS